MLHVTRHKSRARLTARASRDEKCEQEAAGGGAGERDWISDYRTKILRAINRAPMCFRARRVRTIMNNEICIQRFRQPHTHVWMMFLNVNNMHYTLVSTNKHRYAWSKRKKWGCRCKTWLVILAHTVRRPYISHICWTICNERMIM